MQLGMGSSYSPSRAWWVSRCTTLLRALLGLFVRAAFLVAALLYASLSVWSDTEYKLGLLTMQPRHFQASSRLFPLIRSHRSAPAYFAILTGDSSQIGEIQWALQYDPYAADMIYGLCQLQLRTQDIVGYTACAKRLDALPGVK